MPTMAVLPEPATKDGTLVNPVKLAVAHKPARTLQPEENVAPSPAVVAARPGTEAATLINPVKLALAPKQVLTFRAEEKVAPSPAVIVQVRRHYVVNADMPAGLDAILPIQTTTATMPLQ
jgi:hypothetical protein